MKKKTIAIVAAAGVGLYLVGVYRTHRSWERRMVSGRYLGDGQDQEFAAASPWGRLLFAARRTIPVAWVAY